MGRMKKQKRPQTEHSKDKRILFCQKLSARSELLAKHNPDPLVRFW